MRVARTVILASIGLLATSLAEAAPNNIGKCEIRYRTNYFNGDNAPPTQAGELCPADPEESLFTREGAMFCPTWESYAFATEAQSHGWHFIPLAGMAAPKGEVSGEEVSAEHFGCTVVHDGKRVNFLKNGAYGYETDLGVTGPKNVRNALVDMRSSACHWHSEREFQKQWKACLATSNELRDRP